MTDDIQLFLVCPRSDKIYERHMRNLLKLILVFIPFFASAKGPSMDGTFIQLQSWMTKIPAQEWHRDLNAMRAAGIKTLVLQWLQYDADRFYPVNVEGVDPIEEILTYADNAGMDVYLGLVFDSRWWKLWDNDDFLESTARRNAKFAKKIWKRYGHHKSISGWYLPFELIDSDYDQDTAESLKGFLRTMARACRKLSGRHTPVAASVFFQGNYSPYDTEKILTQVLKGSELSVLMVQDGVGANSGWATQIEEKVVPYLKAYQNVSRTIGAQMWTVVESFESVRDAAGQPIDRVPADLARLLTQIEAAKPVSERIITFDFFHYMSPFRGERQRVLYEAYMEFLSHQPDARQKQQRQEQP